MTRKIFYKLSVFLSAPIFLIYCNDNSRNDERLSSGHGTAEITDSTLLYADDIIDDSTLSFLDSLPQENKTVTPYDIELQKNISVGEYVDFLNVASEYPAIIMDERLSNDVAEKLKHKRGIVQPSEINFTALRKVLRYFASTDSFQRKKDDLIARITDTALFLTNKILFRYPDAGPGSPRQIGLAYSWGVKNYKERYIPSKEDRKDSCRYKIYGLDCSGFVSTLFNCNGIKMIPGKAEAQRQASYLAKILKPYFGTIGFNVVDKMHISTAEVQTGDIVYRYNETAKVARHIGIVLKGLDGTLRFCESHGNPGDCDANLHKGPSMSVLNKIERSGYRVVRIIGP